MEKIFEKLLQERAEERGADNTLIPAFNLVSADARMNSLIKKCMGTMSASQITVNRDDAIQEIAVFLIKYINRYAENRGKTLKDVLDILDRSNNEQSAKFWAYISKCVHSEVKNKYGRAQKNEDGTYKRNEIETIFFKELGMRIEVEEEIIDKVMSTAPYSQTEKNIINNPILRYIQEYKEELLTRKQIEFLEAGGIGYDRKAAHKFRLQILKRVTKKLGKDKMNTKHIRKLEILKQIEELEGILIAKDFEQALVKKMDTKIIIDLLYYNNFTYSELKQTTAVYKGVSKTITAGYKAKIVKEIEKKITGLKNAIEE